MRIKDRLRQIESTRLKGGSSPGSESRSDYPRPDAISPIIPAKRESSRGSVLVKERDFSAEHSHGTVKIRDCLALPSSLLSFVAKDSKFQGIDVSRLLFLDTETTSLSGGAGACAFLIGLGYFTDDGFRITQLFMRDFGDEAAQLDQLNQIVADHPAIVTYNGKTFDVPLLQTRNVLHRLRASLDDLPHLDLLHAVRRHWKHKLPDCSLVTVEKHILRVDRVGDIPGYWIPQMYFDYLRTQNAYPLQPIFYHNQCDIIALVAFLTRLLQLFENPAQEADSLVDLLSVGKTYEDLLEFERSIELYTEILEKPGFNGDSRLIRFRQALNHKRLKNWPPASEIWRECIASEAFHPLPFIELAKHYEHRLKNYPTALGLVEKALKEIEIVETIRPKKTWEDYSLDLKYRKRRLKKRILK